MQMLIVFFANIFSGVLRLVTQICYIVLIAFMFQLRNKLRERFQIPGGCCESQYVARRHHPCVASLPSHRHTCTARRPVPERVVFTEVMPSCPATSDCGTKPCGWPPSLQVLARLLRGLHR